MAKDQNIIQQQIDADLKSGKLRKIEDYLIKIEIDIDCQELLDAIGLPYELSEDDETQNVITMRLDEEEFQDVFETCQLTKANEIEFGTRLLNPELGEYCTKVTVLTPNNDTIIFK
tara:strand:+ start:426 stop:773 length:348 start_codon:yes stop_codon:yes gene_type:complete